jgi:hypothetical protein
MRGLIGRGNVPLRGFFDTMTAAYDRLVGNETLPTPDAGEEQAVAALGFDDNAIPYLPKATYLRLTDTIPEVKNYAAGGFHVSTSRGVAGGCADSALGYGASGSKPTKCAKALNRVDVGAAWLNAAMAYSAAYSSVSGGGPVDYVKPQLKEANLLADAAYKLEGVAPPRDPGPSGGGGGVADGTGDTDPMAPKPVNWALWGSVSLASAALLGGGAWLAFRDKQPDKVTRHLNVMGRARVRRVRVRRAA